MNVEYGDASDVAGAVMASVREHREVLGTKACPICGRKAVLPEVVCHRCKRSGGEAKLRQMRAEARVVERKVEAREERRKLDKRGGEGNVRRYESGRLGLAGGRSPGKTAEKRRKGRLRSERLLIGADEQTRRIFEEKTAETDRNARLSYLTRLFGAKELKKLSSEDLEELTGAVDFYPQGGEEHPKG